MAHQGVGIAGVRLVGGEESEEGDDDGRMMALIYASVINARVLGTDYGLEAAA